MRILLARAFAAAGAVFSEPCAKIQRSVSDFQRLTSQKRESFVNPARLPLTRLIKKHTHFVTTTCCARRPKRPGFLLAE
jgi:hypothetical protein